MWGQFEVSFDEVLNFLKKENGTEGEIEGRQFKRRKKRFRTEAKTYFASCPTVMKYIDGILNDAAVLYPKRNMVAHGQFEARVEYSYPKIGSGEKPRAKIFADSHSIIGDKKIFLSFTEESLEDLYYSNCHLCGRIDSIIDGSAASLLPSHERPFLEKLAHSIRRTSPTNSKPHTPPESSGA